MKLPAIETPEHSSESARAWAYRLGALPWGTSVEDVALVIQAAMNEAVEKDRAERK